MLARVWLAAVLAGAIGTAALGAVAAAGDGPQESALAHADLPYYSQPDLRPRWGWRARWRSTGALTLVDQHGRNLDEQIFARGPTIVSFFWSGCVSQCPIAIDLLRAAKLDAPVLLITDQPLIDRPAALAAYADQLALPGAWRLATGRPTDVFAFARNGLFTDVETRNADGTPRHAELNYLIDRKGRLRGLYQAGSPLDVQRLATDYARLIAEERGLPLADDDAARS